MGWYAGLSIFQGFRGRTKKLIRAAVEAARGQSSPPDELRLYWMCQRYPGALPETGGMFDQDYVLMVRMITLDNIYGAITRMRSLTGHAIHNLTPGERRVLEQVRRMGLL